MDIGIAKERAAAGQEIRVMLLPAEVKKLVVAGHRVFVEKAAGEGIFVSDGDYQRAGAAIVQRPSEVFDKELVVKLKPPLPQEFKMLKDNILFSMLHAEQNPSYVKMLKKSRAKAVAMELIKNEFGERLVNCVKVAGEQGMLLALRHSMKSPRECKVLVLGYGNIAGGALGVAYALGAEVKILRKSEYKDIRHHLHGKDIVVNGIRWPKNLRDKKVHLVTKDMLKYLNKGAVVLDLAVDFPGPIETCRPNTLNKPSYYVEGVRHICIFGYPGLAPISSSHRYSKQVLPLVLDIARYGLENAPAHIKRAVIDPLYYKT